MPTVGQGSVAPARIRAPRADAARNRAALVQAARDAFTRGGEDVSLEGVAKAAGVGIGTLYRNFPTRDDLVAAVYGSELDAVLARAGELIATLPADQALRAWMDAYAAFTRTKRGMAESLRAGALKTAAATVRTRERVNAVIQRFLEAGTDSGALRTDLAADDVTTALIGVFLATRDTSDTAQIDRLLDLLVDGLRAR